jgi:hypothetical protein
VWNDYRYTPAPWSRLDTEFAAKHMQELAAVCGVKDLTVLDNTNATKENVLATIAAIGQRCEPDDMFVWYYTGHGDSMPDQDGDEHDGKDEAFCLVAADGQCNYGTYLRDDDFSDALISALPTETRVIVLSDSCHSGTILDLGKPHWNEREAISIAGCRDEQTSAGTGKGGMFSHSMLLAVHDFSAGDVPEKDYTIAHLYNQILYEDDHTFHSEQEITLQCSARTAPNTMPWPLVPEGDYVAPMRRPGGM